MKRVDLFQLLSGVVERAVELGDLAVSAALKGNVVVLVSQGLRLFVGVGYRLCDQLAEEYRDGDTQHDDDRRDYQQLIAQGLDDARYGGNLTLDYDEAFARRGAYHLGECELFHGVALEHRLALVVADGSLVV